MSDEKENVGRRRNCVSSSKEAAENSIWNVQARLMKFAAATSLFTSFYALSSLPPEICILRRAGRLSPLQFPISLSSHSESSLLKGFTGRGLHSRGLR